jgi:hypothetical protein
LAFFGLGEPVVVAAAGLRAVVRDGDGEKLRKPGGSRPAGEDWY